MDRRRGDVLESLALVLAGVLLLLTNLGLVPLGTWQTLARWWPLLLVAMGGAMMAGIRVRGMLRAVLTFLIVMVVGVAISTATGFVDRASGWAEGEEITTTEYEAQMPETPLESVLLEVDMGSSHTVITDLPGDDRRLFHSIAEHTADRLQPVMSYDISGREAQIRYTRKFSQRSVSFFGLFGSVDRHTLELGALDVPTKYDLTLGSGDIRLGTARSKISSVRLVVGSGSAQADFATLNGVNSELTVDLGSGGVDLGGLANLSPGVVRIDVGSGHAELNFDGKLGVDAVSVDAEVGSGSVTIRLPEGAGYKIYADVGSGHVTADGEEYDSHYFKSDRPLISENYESALVKFHIRANVGSGDMRIVR